MSENGHSRFSRKVLVLNSTHSPINICGWKRAMNLLFLGKADPLESAGEMINGRYALPSVIRLHRYIPLPFQSVVLTRKNIFLRDNYTCQYCGRVGINLTIDHIIPKSRGGNDSWENIVVSCMRCNNRKGDRMPAEAEMPLVGEPYKPPSNLYLQLTRYGQAPKSWHDYFFSPPTNGRAKPH